MIQHVCDRCGATMTTWRVLAQSEECDPKQGAYDFSRDRYRITQEIETCMICQNSFAAWLEAGKDRCA